MSAISRQWSVLNIPGVALCIVWDEGNPATQICQMRWTDGLRPDVEAAVLADAQFIVRAVNVHDDLVAALRSANHFITNGVALGFIRMPDPDVPDPAKDVPLKIKAALALAEKNL